MKKNILYPLVGLAVLLGMSGCSEDRYETSVVKQIELFLNDNEWFVNVGLSTRPLFIYDAGSGEYKANYTTHYRFPLGNGTYKIVATPAPDQLIPSPVNLNELIIPQDPESRRRVEISNPVEYSSPFDTPLSIRMYSRTGVLRLRATDTKSDRSYSTVRAIVTAPISGYRVVDGSYVESPVELVRDRATTSGGVNYTDDFVTFQTASVGQAVTVRIDYLDSEGSIIQSKPMEGSFPIYPNDTTQIDFPLNDTEHPIIQDYTVTILSEGWNEENITPEVPIMVPDGYTYAAPGTNLRNLCNELFDDESVSEVKLFLRAGTTYNLGRLEIKKPLSILGQEPSSSETRTVMDMGNGSINGNLDYLHFENLDINPTDDYLFRPGQLTFHVKDLTFKSCNINNLRRSMWYAEISTDDSQMVDNFVIEDCRMLNFNAGNRNYSMISLGANNPIYNIVIRNSTVHTATEGLRNTLIGGTRDQKENMNITLENSTFVRLGPANMTFFDLRTGSAMTELRLTVKNNLFSGTTASGQGRWMYLDGKAVKDFSGNYRTSDFVLNNWGVDAAEVPAATVTKDELFEDAATGNLTIKDRSSEVYTNRIGDPHWLE